MKLELKLTPPLLLAIAVVALVAVVGTALSILAVWPTDLERLSQEQPAREDRSHRRATTGCALTRQKKEETCAPVAVQGTREEEVAFARTTKAGPQKLIGTLTLPLVDGKRPAVILLHGSGPTPRDASMKGDLVTRLDGELQVFAALAHHLGELGFVVLRWDKRACVRCYRDKGIAWEPSLEEYWRDSFSFFDFVHDAEAAIDYLQTRPEVEGGAVVVVGHSEGAALAPGLGDDARVKAVVMLAGFSGPYGDVIVGQLARYADVRERQHDLLGAWALRREADKLRVCFDTLDDKARDEEVCLGGGVKQKALREIQQWTAASPARLHALPVPLCALQGGVDRNIFAEELENIERAQAPDVELHRIPAVAHTLADALAPTDPPVVDKEVLRRLDAFLASVNR